MQKSIHTPEYAALRAELLEMRERAGLSQRELAQRLHVPHSWVAKVELGERRLDLVEFCRVADACAAEPRHVFEQFMQRIGRPECQRTRGRSR
ncbi:MAG: XRE family transcriptional regulator [Planctomycetota bacterium]|nr:MAG: XRE family transcriptional regulator [Planctomycetota bacterium]